MPHVFPDQQIFSPAWLSQAKDVARRLGLLVGPVSLFGMILMLPWAIRTSTDLEIRLGISQACTIRLHYVSCILGSRPTSTM